jgi:para-aminobenzoate synthetase component 1
LLDSALVDPSLGRYSYLSADPFDAFQIPGNGEGGLATLEQKLAKWRTPGRANLPPFTGGAVVLLGYELGRSLERLPATRYDEFQFPAIAACFYDTILALDHLENRAWLISQGFPERNLARRVSRAEQRIEQFRSWLDQPAPPRCQVKAGTALNAAALAPQFAVPGPAGLTSNFSADQYRHAVQRVVDYIHAGDVFQVNLSQRLLMPAQGDALSLYLRLRQRNPAPFAAWFDLGDTQILSASPERFLCVSDDRVEARPIKGTRRRTPFAEASLFAGDDLVESEKDRAENIMIVDLLRNDLSRVCEADSVRVTQLCGLETYQYVQHLVSAIEGRLSAGKTAVDLVRAAFPGGSITGAPKIRAMEIIAELEPTARGPYCGCLGYFGFDGSADLNILIRTITASRGWWQFPVGGGIVAQSSPEREYEETWHKAEGLLRAVV